MKRLLDICLASFLIIVLLPLYLIISLVIIYDLGWPVIAKKRYPGLNEEIFTLYRFKTMRPLRDERGQYLLPSERVTKVGYFLKKYKLDHLPELFNVLKGDMSLVGPRPGSIRTIPSTRGLLTKRHDVRPGILSLSQVQDKPISWEQAYELDLYYVAHQSLSLDIKIIIQGCWCLFKRIFQRN